MAVFEPRTLQEILTSMIDFVRVNSNITDFNRGSLIRTTLEAAAFEDDEIYYQMVQILKEFSFRTASREGLYRRAADYDLYPLTAAPSSGSIVFMDDALERTYLSGSTIPAGSSTLTVEDAAVFAGGTPFTARLAEGAATEEDVTVNTVTLATNLLTLAAPTVNAHTGLGSAAFDDVLDEYYLDAARVSYVDATGSVKAINAGQLVAAPTVGELGEIRFLTIGGGTVAIGDFKSSLIGVRAERSGRDGNVGPLRIISFPTTKPFTDALVLNPESAGGGIADETDEEFAERVSETIAGLSRGTISAILGFLVQVQEPTTLQRVARITVLEEFVRDADLPGDGRFRVYIDDGTGSFSASVTTFAQGNLNGAVTAGDGTFDLDVTEGTFATRGHVILDPNGTPEILEYSAISSATPAVVTLVTAATRSHLDDAVVLQVEEITESSTARRFYSLDNIAMVENTARVFTSVEIAGVDSVSELVQFVPMVTALEDSDYYLNEGVGQIEIIPDSLPAAGTGLYVLYNHYSGLVERAQRTLDGDLRDLVNFPGVRSGGVKGLVLPATSLVIDVDVDLDILEGFDRVELVERADRVIRNYINELQPGGDFIIHEMVERVMGLAGLYDLRVSTPSSNVLVDYATVAVAGTIRVS